MSITTTNNNAVTATLFTRPVPVKAEHQTADFPFRVSNTWVSGTHSRSTISSFPGPGQEMAHMTPRVIESDQPAVLAGQRGGPTALEYLLHAFASYLSAGVANAADARGVELTYLSSAVEGYVVRGGIPGSDGTGRSGFQGVKVIFDIRGYADDETLRGLVEQSRRSASVYDVLANPIPVSVDVVTG
jgi:uncharacterized OsmC-like protein